MSVASRTSRRLLPGAAALALLAAPACKRAPDPEAAVRAEFVARQALAADAGGVLHLTSSDEVFFDDGWFPMETGKDGFHGEAWRWMGRSSLLRLRGHAAPMKLAITGWVPLHVLGSPPMVTLRWRGVRVEAFLPPPGRFTKTILVTADMQAGSTYSDFTIETSTIGNEPGDPRELGFALAEVRWEAAKD
jgi:hypothetical protein